MVTNANIPVENIEWNISSASDVTVYVRDTGDDTAIARYMNMGAEASAVILRTDQIVQIVTINGQTLKDPLTINANTNWDVTRRSRFRVRSFVIRAFTGTNVKVFALTVGRRGD